MNNSYDVLIVGGGIAGLYLNYKLLKSKKHKKTLLVEKYGVIGGRIQTKQLAFKNKRYSFRLTPSSGSEEVKKTFIRFIDMSTKGT